MLKRRDIVYWILSVVLSLVFLAIIGVKWFNVQRIKGYGVNVVKSASDLESIIESSDTIEFNSGQKPFMIPTGYFIQSLSFNTPSDVNITGYIWQKYPEDFPKDFKKGFVFPEEVDSSDTKLDQVYEVTGEIAGKTYQTLGWYFDVTLRQSFDYSKYPLDFLTVWIRLWPKDFKNDAHIFFAPDFDSFSDPGKATCGLDRDIVPGEWEIDETFFSYNTMSYDTNFGFFENVTHQTYNEFYINLGLQRKFINAFVINLVPLFVVSLLLFAQVMTVSGEKDLAERFGFNTSGAITTCSALFFVVMLAHVQVRRLFSGSGLVYIEYFYLIMYGVILLTALNAYVFSLGKTKHFNAIYYRDNFFVKLVYWPLVLSMMAVVTWIKV